MEEEKTLYTINVGGFLVEETVYPDRCLSASFGGSGVASDTIPWADTEYNPWDYKALYEEEEVTTTNEDGEEMTEVRKKYTGEFVLDAIVIPTPTPTPSDMDRLSAQVLYTATLTDTLL